MSDDLRCLRIHSRMLLKSIPHPLGNDLDYGKPLLLCHWAKDRSWPWPVWPEVGGIVVEHRKAGGRSNAVPWLSFITLRCRRQQRHD